MLYMHAVMPSRVRVEESELQLVSKSQFLL